METNNKTKMNSSNGYKISDLSGGKKSEKESEKAETEKSLSEADQLTLRAWKKTFENRKKVA